MGVEGGKGGALFSTVKTRINRHFYSAKFEYILHVEPLRLGKDLWDTVNKLICLPNLFARVGFNSHIATASCFSIDIESNLKTRF